MNSYTNHFNCSKNNDTGETIIQFFQISPRIVPNEEGPKVEGADIELVSSVVMTEQSARELVSILSGVLQ